MKAGQASRQVGRRALLEIIVRRDGQVVFETFTDEMLTVAAELAPADPAVRERLRQRERLRKRGAHGQVPDR